MSNRSQASDSRTQTGKLRFFQAWSTHLARLLGGWLPGIADFEGKYAIGLHLWQDMQHARDIRTRLWELRVGKPDAGVTEPVMAVVARLACAQDEAQLVAAAYLGVKRALAAAYREYIGNTHRVWDAPTVSILERAAAATEAQIAWAEAFLARVAVNDEDLAACERWRGYADELLTCVGGVAGVGEPAPGGPDAVDPIPATTCLLPFAEAKRDRRFKTQLRGFPRPDPGDLEAHREWQFANYCQEMQAAETIASVMWEVAGMDWDFYYDLARHCYDEVRHSQLGIERLAHLGKSVFDYPQIVGNYAWRQLMDPVRRYCTLTYVIEQDAFKLKNETYRDYVRAGDLESADAIMYDMIDETMHVRFGMRWVPEMLDRLNTTLTVDELVEECARNTALYSPSPAQRQYAKPA